MAAMIRCARHAETDRDSRWRDALGHNRHPLKRLARLVIDSLALGAIRLLVGAVGLLAWTTWHRTLSKPDLRNASLLAAGACIAAYQPLFFYGVKITGVATGTMAALGSAPLFAALLGKLFLDEKPPRVFAITAILAIAGIALLTLRDGARVHLFGVLLSLGAGLSYAGYASLCSRLVQHGPS